MNRVLLGLLVAMFVALFTATRCQEPSKESDPPKQEAKKEEPQVKPDAEKAKPSKQLVEMVNRYEEGRRGGRQHGAKLSITAIAKAGEDDKPELQIGWEIDYDGPRPPLTILRPDLQAVTNQATKLYVYYDGADGKPAEFYFASPSTIKIMPVREEHFATSKRGPDEKGVVKVVGKIVIPLNDAKVWTNPPDRERDLPTDLELGNCYFQLRHWAFERGGKLDAWTGELHSNIVRLTK